MSYFLNPGSRVLLDSKGHNSNCLDDSKQLQLNINYINSRFSFHFRRAKVWKYKEWVVSCYFVFKTTSLFSVESVESMFSSGFFF